MLCSDNAGAGGSDISPMCTFAFACIFIIITNKQSASDSSTFHRKQSLASTFVPPGKVFLLAVILSKCCDTFELRNMCEKWSEFSFISQNDGLIKVQTLTPRQKQEMIFRTSLSNIDGHRHMGTCKSSTRAGTSMECVQYKRAGRITGWSIQILPLQVLVDSYLMHPRCNNR